MPLKDKIEECLPNPDPVARPDYTEMEVQALRAVWRGEATQRQQRAAIDFVIRAAGTHDTSFRPQSPYLTAFAEGKRHVGTTVIFMLKSAETHTDPDKIAARKAGDANDRRDNR